MPPMPPLHRHQLAHLGDAAWQALLRQPHEAVAADCLRHWAARRLPLVVTRQDAPRHAVSLGLAAPQRWMRLRIALAVPAQAIVAYDEFPPAEALAALLPPAQQAAWAALGRAWQALGVRPRVYGSHGWQLLSGLDCTRPGSDIDLWFAVHDAAQADAVARQLAGVDPHALPRLDGELLFPDGRAVAWREWLAWREGRCRTVLAKGLVQATLLDAGAFAAATAP